MESIKDIIQSNRPIDDIISDLKVKSVDIPAWETLLTDYEPTMHAIVNDTYSRKDKLRSDGVIEKPSRIYIGLEKLLVKRMTEFMFAIPVKRVYHNTEKNETRQGIAKAIEKIYKYARTDSNNIKRGNNLFASCEMATIWYVVESPNNLYGFPCKYKLRCKTFSPMDGTRLYPLLDEMGDMLAMSFEYSKKVSDKTVTFFETYTSEAHYKWQNDGSKWERVTAELLSIGKIPVVYAYRPNPIFSGLSYLRNEIEYTLSRNSDVVAYNSAPILKVSGQIQGEEVKGKSMRVFRVENGGDVSYVAWSQANEALRYHVDTLIKLFWSQAQMPDISFDTMSHLGSIGYDARQTLLTDAHLKVGDESGVWIEALERECSVIKAFLKLLNTSWASEVDNVEVEHIITPFIQNDESSTIDRLLRANGNKPIMSQYESIAQAGYSNDPMNTLEQIQRESAQQDEAGNGNENG